MDFLILAAGRGSRLGSLTETRPKIMNEYLGRTLLDWHISNIRTVLPSAAIHVVVGYRAELFVSDEYRIIFNPSWNSSNIGGSLLCADEILQKAETMVIYGDVWYEPILIEQMLLMPTPCVASVAEWKKIWELREVNPLDDLETFRIDEHKGLITEIGQKPQSLQEIEGQFAGLFSLNPSVWHSMSKEPQLPSRDITSSMQIEIRKGILFGYCSYLGRWREFDLASDFKS